MTTETFGDLAMEKTKTFYRGFARMIADQHPGQCYSAQFAAYETREFIATWFPRCTRD
jgi:hypothetical protein